MAKSFENLEVWQLSMDLAEEVYRASKSFPADERFGLTSQLRRAVISISSNIAEGSNRKSKKGFARFITIARGSLNEVESQLMLAYRLDYVSQDDYKEILTLINKIGAKMGAFKKHLQERT